MHIRKKGIIAIFVALLFITNIAFSKSAYHVTPGNIYPFVMEKIQIDIKIGGSEYTGDGYTLASNHISQGSSASVEVNSNGGTYVGYTITSGAFSQTFNAEWVGEDEHRLESEILSVLWHAQPYLTNPSLLTNLNLLIFYPFVECVYVEDFFEEFVDGTNYALTMLLPHLNSPEFQAVSDINGDIYTFESYFTGNTETSGGSPEYDINFKHQTKFVYDTNIGVLYGMHYLATGKGTFNGQKAEFTVESLIRQLTYSMPDFTLGGFTFNIAEDWWIIAAAGGGLLLIIIIVIIATSVGKKKKPKKKKKKSTKKKKK